LSAIERLVQDADALGVTLTSEDAARLLTLTEELARWNRSYNLTAISAPAAMVTHHLLDSLAVHPDLSGRRIADAGTGAGFPGLPLALCNPQRHFTLIDSTAKKVRFVTHAAGRLNLTNVQAVHARVESMRPDEPFDTVLARALAPIPTLLEKVTPICGPRTQVLAMKGKWPAEELAALSSHWHVVRSRELHVPGLDAARCLIVFARTDAAAECPPEVS
jgi:16S rRNA (guanine527-N7)-methyltransferase